MDQAALLVALAFILLMVGAAVTIGILLGYPAAHWIGDRFGEFLSCLPREKFSEPQPALGIGAAKAVRGDLAGAVDAYETLLIDHPGEKEIYIRLLEIAFGPMRHPAYGEEVLQRGLSNLAVESDRAVLLNLADSLRKGEFKPFKYLALNPGLDSCPEPLNPPPLGGKATGNA